MNSGTLNEHDAQRGAESKGEFLSMTGNSAWYLLGSSGASLLLVIVLWGMLGLSLVVCLLLALLLCGLSLAYVFALKNNRPAHYDSDFFESVLVEAGLWPLAFGPRAVRPANPFRSGVMFPDADVEDSKRTAPVRHYQTSAPTRRSDDGAAPEPMTVTREKPSRRAEEVPTVPLVAYERLQHELNTTSDLLEEALAEREEGLL